jgi:hypothetical protein
MAENFQLESADENLVVAVMNLLPSLASPAGRHQVVLEALERRPDLSHILGEIDFSGATGLWARSVLCQLGRQDSGLVASVIGLLPDVCLHDCISKPPYCRAIAKVFGGFAVNAGELRPIVQRGLEPITKRIPRI